jgi:hypothetical protein
MLCAGIPGGYCVRFRSFFGVALIFAGAISLAYGGFHYTAQRTPLTLGPLHLKFAEHHHIKLPVWFGFACIASGTVVLLIRGKRR